MPESSEMAVSTRDVEEQLQHMLSCRRFKMASKQAEFLALVVDRALQGLSCREDEIGKILYPNFIKDESDDVRIGMRKLRKHLEGYYEFEGREDLVVIALPAVPDDKRVKLQPGEAYTPVFTYNPGHVSGREMRLAQFHLGRMFPEDLDRAEEHLRKALDAAPNHVEALTLLAEVLIMQSTHESEQAPINEDCTHLAEELLSKAKSLSPGWWRVHAAYGALYAARNDKEAAWDAFLAAGSIDPGSTGGHRAYASFLVQLNWMDEALHKARQIAEANFDNPAHRAVYGATLAQSGKMEEAEAILLDAFQMDRGNAAVNLCLALLCARQHKEAEMDHYLERLKILIHENSWNLFHKKCRKIFGS